MLKSKLIFLILTYKYPLLVPLALLEGHLISLIAGFIAHTTGQLNPFIAGACIVLGNLIGDVTLYWIGYYRGEKFVHKWGKKFGMTDESLEKGRAIFLKYHNPILFVSKITNGLGLAIAVLITAGMMRVRFMTYLLWNIFGEVIWTTGLICVGYFLGNVYESVDGIIGKIGSVVIILAILVAGYFYIKTAIKKKMNV